CQSMLAMAIEIAQTDPSYEEFIVKFAKHFLRIAGSMDRVGGNQDGLWDEEDGFYYDALVLPDGNVERMKVHSMVGLLTLAATAGVPAEAIERFPRVMEQLHAFAARQPELSANIHPIGQPGVQGRRLLSVLNETKLRRVLAQMLDEDRFLSPYGIRSLSRWHL